jgi:Ca2+-transporting ATPase
MTARSIADNIGLPKGSTVTGDELEAMSGEELTAKLADTNIFARVLPEHKMRIVEAFKARGDIVAMTGDGVNDAPALKYADIGIAMGQRGTQVAREAADMVLLDDNFTTIVESARDGRRIYDNIRKAVGYVFVVHIPIALVALIGPALGFPPLLMPIHVVLLELIIDPTCSIVFERQPAEKNIMDRPPRSILEPLMTRALVWKSILQGLVIFAAVFASYAALLHAPSGAPGHVEAVARSVAFLVLVLSNLFIVFVNRSNDETILKSHPAKGDRVAYYIGFLVVAVMAVALYLPAANRIVLTAPLNWQELLLAVGLAAVATLWFEVIKVIRKIGRKRKLKIKGELTGNP